MTVIDGCNRLLICVMLLSSMVSTGVTAENVTCNDLLFEAICIDINTSEDASVCWNISNNSCDTMFAIELKCLNGNVRARSEPIVISPRTETTGMLKVSGLRSQLPVISISYVRGSSLCSRFAVASLPQSTKSTGSYVEKLLPSFVGIVGMILVASLTILIVPKRESIKMKFDWAIMKYEKEEPHYREFINNWNNDTSPMILDQYWKTLCNSVMVPTSLIAKYEQTKALISESTLPNSKKIVECNKLRQAIVSRFKDVESLLQKKDK